MTFRASFLTILLGLAAGVGGTLFGIREHYQKLRWEEAIQHELAGDTHWYLYRPRRDTSEVRDLQQKADRCRNRSVIFGIAGGIATVLSIAALYRDFWITARRPPPEP